MWRNVIMKQKLLVKRKSRKGKGKTIGNNFQWEVCKKLSLSVSNKDDIFQPTPSSGARGTRRKKTQETQATQHGDITYENPIGKPLIDIWSIETKTGYGKVRETKKGITKTNWCMLDCIEGDSENPIFLDFWLQTLEDAEASNREPILIFRRPSKQPCIVIRYGYFFDILRPLHNTIFKEWDYDSLSINISKEALLIMSFKNFIDWTNRNLLEFAKMSIQSEK